MIKSRCMMSLTYTYHKTQEKSSPYPQSNGFSTSCLCPCGFNHLILPAASFNQMQYILQWNSVPFVKDGLTELLNTIKRWLAVVECLHHDIPCMFNHIQILWFGGQSLKWMLLSWGAVWVTLALLSGMSCCSSIRLCCWCVLMCGPIWSRTISSEYKTQINRMPIYMKVQFALIPTWSSNYNLCWHEARHNWSKNLLYEVFEPSDFQKYYLSVVELPCYEPHCNGKLFLTLRALRDDYSLPFNSYFQRNIFWTYGQNFIHQNNFCVQIVTQFATPCQTHF